jgi:hypothetical protein
VSLRGNPPLHVIGFVGSRRGDPDRGPQVHLNREEAHRRLLVEGELAWVQGPRRSELATVVIDEHLPRGGVILRDITGVAVSEVIRLQKPDYDTPDTGRNA